MKYLLMVTWIYPHQPPTNYQIEFDTQAACMTARTAVYEQAVELRQSALAEVRTKAKVARIAPNLLEAGVQFPDASAACVPR